ncbi:MAG: hypothetical protein HY262_11415, partial [Chloroflexi bacterium]|nr:hypothetical protein [Chloroflexota bacterium]
MSLTTLVQSASRLATRPAAGDVARASPLFERAIRRLWLHDRPLAELRWAAVTLAAMALLGLLAGLLHASSDLSRVWLVSTTAALVMAGAAWGPYATRLAHARAVRLWLGPAVLAVAIVGGGMTDLATLQMPPAAPMVALALAFAALTPGYLIAAGFVLVTASLIFLAHTFAAFAPDVTSQATDRFVVNVVVTLLASSGMAIVVRFATEAEARANQLAARSRERLDVLQRVNDIVGRFDGTQPIRSVVQGVVDDVARDFDIALISMYLPDADGRLSMAGVAGYQEAFHTIEPGVGVIGRAAACRAIQYVPDVLADPDYRAARADVRS